VASAVLLKAANGLAIARIKANWSSETGVSTIGKFLVIWDGLKCHRSRLVWDFVRQQQGRIWLEFLPAYAPELNPVEFGFGTLCRGISSEQEWRIKMTTELPPKAAGTVALNHILGSAVVLNWNALACGSTDCLVKIEYHIGSDGSLECLTLWARAREYWSLICDCSIHRGWSDGPRFSNGYHSHRLGRLLQSIMLNQNRFRHNRRPNSNGTLEIGSPTAEDTTCATARISEAFQRLA